MWIQETAIFRFVHHYKYKWVETAKWQFGFQKNCLDDIFTSMLVAVDFQFTQIQRRLVCVVFLNHHVPPHLNTDHIFTSYITWNWDLQTYLRTLWVLICSRSHNWRKPDSCFSPRRPSWVQSGRRSRRRRSQRTPCFQSPFDVTTINDGKKSFACETSATDSHEFFWATQLR